MAVPFCIFRYIQCIDSRLLLPLAFFYPCGNGRVKTENRRNLMRNIKTTCGGMAEVAETSPSLPPYYVIKKGVVICRGKGLD